MSFLNLAGDSACGTYSGAECASLTLVSVDGVGEKLLTYACGTLLVNDMGYIFVAEVSSKRK